MRKKKLGVIIGGSLAIIVVGLLAFSVDVRVKVSEALGAESYEITRYDSDLIGTKLVTSTVYVPFGVGVSTAGGLQPAASSSYVAKVGGNSLVTLNFEVGLASTTSKFQVDLEGSNDWFCDTSTTTVSNNTDIPLVGEIHWTDISDHLRGKTQTTAWTNVSSTNMLSFANPTDKMRKEVVLENMDYECIRVNVAAVSTTLWATVASKK